MFDLLKLCFRSTEPRPVFVKLPDVSAVAVEAIFSGGILLLFGRPLMIIAALWPSYTFLPELA